MNLTVHARETGKKNLQNLRREGFVAGEVYGHGIGNVHVAVPLKDCAKALKESGETSIIQLSVDGKKMPVLIHGVQRDSVTDAILHVDFYHIRAGEKITAHVPIEFVDEAPAVKEKGGLLNRVMSEVEVEALPEHLPHHFTLSLAALDDLDKSLHIKDLSIPKDVQVLVDPETVIVSVGAPEEEEEAPAVETTEPVVEAEEKKAERAKKEEVEQG